MNKNEIKYYILIYRIRIYPANNRIVNIIDRILKYLSIKFRILIPNFNINSEIRKNLADLLTIDAIKNRGNDILKAPAVMVNIL